MSEFYIEDPRPSEDPEDRLALALAGFTGCIAEALPDICSSGLIPGDSYVPFDPDPDNDDCDVMCSQVWVRVTDVQVQAVQSFDDGDCAATLRIGIEVGVLRCFEIEEEGEAPTQSEMLGYAIQSMNDMNDVYCAAMSCEVWEAISAGQWLPQGPLGGQYGGTWTFTVEV